MECSVSGCQRKPKAHGLCPRHYMRFRRHGSPNAGSTAHGALVAFLELAREHDNNHCLLWPFGHNRGGYGTLWCNGQPYSATRFVCEHTHGAPPTPSHECAHSCRTPACVNPRHLRWATRAENLADRVEHDTHTRGERSPNAKLTAQQVREIRSSEQHYVALAKTYGVSPTLISRIRRRIAWAWLEEGV